MVSWKFETEWRRGCAVKVEKLSCKVEEEGESFNQLDVELEGSFDQLSKKTLNCTYFITALYFCVLWMLEI